jgi:endo-1,4-beta-xylanase
VMITELDCNDRRLPANPYARDRWVARAMRDCLEVALAEPAVEGVVCWGLADRYSWLSTSPGTRRWDGLRSRGTLFSDDLRPKAAFRAVEAAHARAAPRA